MASNSVFIFLLAPRPRSLLHGQSAAIACFAGKIRGPRGSGRGETRLERVAVQFVGAELFLPFGESLRHLIVDCLGFLGWIDSDLRLEISLSCHGRGDLVVFANAL